MGDALPGDPHGTGKDNDLHLVRVSLEYFMKQVDDNCYKKRKMLGEKALETGQYAET